MYDKRFLSSDLFVFFIVPQRLTLVSNAKRKILKSNKSKLYCKLHNPDDTKPQKEEQDKTTFIWKEPKLAANLGGLGSYHHLSTTPKAMNFSLNSDV